MNITVRGIVVSEVDFSENDKYIDILTYSHGKISVLCKSVRKKNSVLANKVRLFNFADFELFHTKNTYLLNDVVLIERFFELSQDIENFALCSYFLQLTTKLCDEDVVETEIPRTLISALYAICKQKKDSKLVKCAFEMRIMSISGFKPLIDRCGICHKKSQLDEVYFDVLNGFIFCSSCRDRLELTKSFPITQGVLYAIYHIISCDLSKLYSFNLTNSFSVLYDICEEYVLTQTDYNFKTLDFYKSIGGL